VNSELCRLEERLNHTFRDRGLLERALTHKSHAYERPPAGAIAADNERLEFLGDSILGFVVSECLVSNHPDFPEGRLSKLKAHLVSANWLHEVALELGLGEFLFLGRGEEMSGGRSKRALLSDAVEALIAALYLDGGLEPARTFIEARVIGSSPAAQSGLDEAVTDFKSALQELAQKRGLPQPRYSVVHEDGPEHMKVFTVEVRLGKELIRQASGHSKKNAGQRGAQLLLRDLLQERDEEALQPAAASGSED
jgi:ribonuclease-3